MDQIDSRISIPFHDVTRSASLYIYPTWSFLSFLEVYINFFIKIGKFVSHFSKVLFIFFTLFSVLWFSPSLSIYPQVCWFFFLTVQISCSASLENFFSFQVFYFSSPNFLLVLFFSDYFSIIDYYKVLIIFPVLHYKSYFMHNKILFYDT